jgi:ATP-dependent DNA helicase RecQ
MNKKIKKILKDTFHSDQFRSSQEEIITHVLNGKDSLVLMPTGMGKSLCYELPSLIFDDLTIVLSPLIALMKDQVDKLKKLNIDAAYINSSLSKPERLRRYDDISRGKYKILFVAPERFKKDDFREVIKKRKISLLAVDEAHCVSQWGNDFRPDYSKINEFRTFLNNPTVIALTATATAEVQKDIIKKIGVQEREIKTFNEGICRLNLHLTVIEVIDDVEKFNEIYEILKKNTGNIIIYFNLIKNILLFSQFLDMKKERYLAYHGKLDPSQRKYVQKRFITAKNSIMLATNAFGMGIDKADIRMIIHAEIPGSIESYYQEIGRAGRDGKNSNCILIYSQDDLAVQISFLEWKNPDRNFIKKTYQLLASLGDTLNSYTYEDLQEQLVFKDRGDHRLQTVLNLFDMYHVTEGNLEQLNLKMISILPEKLISEENIKAKQNRDKNRLIDMMNYTKTSDCRREYIHHYFDKETVECDNCDLCDSKV